MKIGEMKMSLHKIDGPALKTPYGSFWVINDKFHRLDGPAVEWASVDKYWYINGYDITRINNIILFMENK